MANNPYDRRQVERFRGRDRMMANRDGMMVAGGPGFETPRALAIEDLDALAFSANVRGQQTATERLEQHHRDDLQRAHRLAWDEGHEVGASDGRAALLDQIAATHGDEVHAVLEQCEQMVNRWSEDPRKVSKADMGSQLNQVESLLSRLVVAHRDGFAADLPF